MKRQHGYWHVRQVSIAFAALIVAGCGQSTASAQSLAPGGTGLAVIAATPTPVLGLRAPVAAPQTLTVLNGYDNPIAPASPNPTWCPSPGVNEHDHCSNQEDGLDLVPSNLADTRLLAPIGGTITWTWRDKNEPAQADCMGIQPTGTRLNLTICHFDRSASTRYPDTGATVTVGTVLGLRNAVDPWVHLSLDDRSSPRPYPPVPFVGSYSIESHAFPSASPPFFNLHCAETITSTNGPVGPNASMPPTPSPYAPAPTIDCSVPKPTPIPTPTPTPATRSVTLTVPGNQAWDDTGIDVAPGTTLGVTADGSVIVASNFSPMTPDGCFGRAAAPVGGPFVAPGLRCWSLVGRIGDGTPFEVGAAFSGPVPSGRLYLGLNDNLFSDNSGSWTASVSIGASSSTVVVQSATAWTDTGIDIPAGSTLGIKATGSIWIEATSAPEGPIVPDGCVGSPNAPGGAYAAPGLPCWSLIGRIGDGAPFEVGSDFTAHESAGRLYLGVNDNLFRDNSGSWTATVRMSSSTP